MKKALFFAAICTAWLSASTVLAQSVNGVRLSELKADYIELHEVRKLWNDKIWISLEYGQSVFEGKDTYIRDDNGKQIPFNSALDAVNKMKSYGYELFQVYVASADSTSQKKYYVLKKK